MRILVLEDIPSGASIICQLLRDNGVEIGTVLPFTEPVREFKQFCFDAIFVDISRTDNNGLVTYSNWQELTRNHCVVVYSVHSDGELAVEFIKKGAQDYLAKDRIEIKSIVRCLKFSVERHQAALNQRRREERMKLVLEDSYDAFVSMNAKLEIIDWNPMAVKTFGWTRQEVLGESISCISPLHLRAQFLRNIKKHYELQRGNFLKTSREIVAQHKSGRLFPAEFGVYRLEEDSVCSFYGFLRDITMEKRTKEELERLVEVRTAELTRSNSELSQFAKIASHDLQEPLRAIEGFALLLAKSSSGKLDDDGEEFVEYIVDGTKRMKDLIQSILVHSQVDAKASIDQVTDCNSVLQEVIVDMQSLMEESDVSLEYNSLPKVAVERSQVVQLFQNLIANCIKYRAEEPLSISIRTKKSIGRWIFSIQDNGIGIEAKYADSIFNMFSRLHSKADYPGTGMGLAICRRIVDTHGGTIWLESNKGKGCNFMFTLPAVMKKKDFKMKNSIDILLVEDTPSDVRLTQEALKESSLNCELSVMDDGEAALQYLLEIKNKENRSLPDIIFLDLNMPKMNGHEVLEEIKKDPMLCSIPVVLLTVSEREEDVLEALSTKMNYYLPKPITSEKASDLVKSIFEVNTLLKDSISKEHTREETHIRLVLAGNPHTSVFALSKLAEAEEDKVRCRVARNANIPPAIQMILSRDLKDEVRLSLCENTSLMSSVLDMLASDKSDDVRMAVSRSAKVSKRVLLKLTEDENVFVADSAKKELACRQR